MINRQTGVIKAIRVINNQLWETVVSLDNAEAKAYLYPALTGEARIGDLVILNTTAVDLGLGSGGYHFVMAVLNPQKEEVPLGDKKKGHIMKLRYTPGQLKVLSVEEEVSPWHQQMERAKGLEGIPVIGGSLHSMLVPCICGINAIDPALRVAYVMTDGGALPLPLSRAVQSLKDKGFICGTVTAGHAFGGDYEAVNLYSGILAAKEVLDAQIIVVLMGPGIVGTGTSWGSTGLEVGAIINAVFSLGGASFTIPRLSFADERTRHQGICHHTLTALAKVALAPTTLVLPGMEKWQKETVLSQLKGREIEKHQLIWGRGLKGIDLAEAENLPLRFMGRSFLDDPYFFLAAAATGETAALTAIKSSPEQVHNCLV